MADSHNKKRYGETWPQDKIDLCLQELINLKPYMTLSGGWAWHFMSPPDHVELKHAHDPRQLLTFYSNIHSSDNCFAVLAADKLIRKGIDPVGRG